MKTGPSNSALQPAPGETSPPLFHDNRALVAFLRNIRACRLLLRCPILGTVAPSKRSYGPWFFAAAWRSVDEVAGAPLEEMG